MAEETLTNKLWKLASYSAYDFLGFGSGSGSNNNTTGNTENNTKKKEEEKEKEKVKRKSIWPSFVKSKSDNCRWGQYDEADASIFDVRGRHYLNDSIKIKSKKSLFKLANLELYDCPVNESYHIVTHKKSWYHKYNKQLPNDTFYLVYNLQLSSLNTSVVATFVLKTNQPPKTHKNHENHENKKKHLLINDQNLIDEMLNDLSDSDSDSDSDDIVDKSDNPAKQTKNDDHDDIEQKEKEEENEDEKEKEEEEKEKEKEEKKCSEKTIKFTVEDMENMPNIEQVIHSDNIVNGYWYPKLGYLPYDKLIWNKFLNGDELFINQRLKTIPRIVEGSWYFTFPQRPALLGMKTPQRCYRGTNYLEIDCEADNSMLVAQIAKAAYHISTYLVFDVVITIEGQQENQLPERILGGFQIRYADSTKATKLT